MHQISAGVRFYKQEYCGCSYLLRNSNEWRRTKGIPKIRIGGETAVLGERYFSDPVIDAEEKSQEVVNEFFSQAAALPKTASNDVQFFITVLFFPEVMMLPCRLVSLRIKSSNQRPRIRGTRSFYYPVYSFG